MIYEGMFLFKGILKPSLDDPYDQMRRNRLVEPRSRTRSISPNRQNGHRDPRSQSVLRGANIPNQEASASRLEWYNTESNFDETDRQKSNFSNVNDEWSNTKNFQDNRNTTGRLIRGPKSRSGIGDWQDVSSPRTPISHGKSTDENWKNTFTTKSTSTSASSNDSRRSILECNVNPYQLVKKNSKDEDDLSDDLSDNALEHCLNDETPCSLFDSSKVKSIERIPNRSAVAAIGGQRIRVFNEPREISDEEDFPMTTGIPIPKVSPKRPPRRLKETKTVLRSILKRGRFEGKRKNVLFNVDNVIFAPEKSVESNVSRRTSRSSIGSKETDELEEAIVHEAQIVEKPKFITIPNIKDPGKQERPKVPEAKIVSRVKSLQPVEKIKIDKFVPSKKLDEIKKVEKTADVKIETKKNILPSEMRKIEQNWHKKKINETKECREHSIKPEDETELEIEIEELKRQLGDIAVDEKDLILKSEGMFFYLTYYKFYFKKYSKNNSKNIQLE